MSRAAAEGSGGDGAMWHVRSIGASDDHGQAVDCRASFHRQTPDLSASVGTRGWLLSNTMAAFEFLA